MSLALAAQHLQAQGRGNDTHLVHMTTGELQALNRLAKVHGRPLSINPKTGLPEAGFLGSILPTVLGGVAGVFAPELLPYIAGGIGLADYAITGSLGQGLMAGMGAWGGGNLAGDISSIGGTSIVNQGGDLAAKGFDAMQQTAATAGETADTVTQASNYINASNFPNLSADQIANMQSQIVANAGDTNAINNVVRAAGAANAGLGNVGANFTTGLGNITSSGSNAVDFVKAHPWDTVSGLSPFVMAGMNAMKPGVYTPPAQENNPFHLQTNSPNFQGTFPTPNVYTPTYAKHGGLMDVKKYAGAGIVLDSSALDNPAGDEALDEDIAASRATPIILDVSKTRSKLTDEAEKQAIADINAGAKMGREPAKAAVDTESHIYYDTDPNTKDLSAEEAGATRAKLNAALAQLDPKSEVMRGIPKFQKLGKLKLSDVMAQEQEAASGGVMGIPQYNLGGYSDGGRLLKGPGDGVSDSIPASIGGKQPARLAEGEFVIPARIVSELGNGSTDAGAKRLYAMMDRIKAKRAKAKDIAADTKAYQYLPA
jgi:hypothetical protein